MYKSFILLTLVVWVYSNTTPHPPCTDSWVPEEYSIDLDKSPLSRWRQVITAKKKYIKALEQDMLKSYPYKITLPLAHYILGPILSLFHNEFLEQCKAIAHFSDVPFTTIIMLQYMYELGTHSTGGMCTAILVNKGDYVFHSRNLDYSFAQILAQLTVTLHFKKNGSTIFTAISQAGFTGVHTGVAFGRFSIDLNQRDIGSLWASFWAYLRGHWRIPALIKHALMTSESYEDVVRMFQTQKLISPCYLIVSGLAGNQGVVITRHRNSVHDVYSLGDALNKGKSYIVQTNYDRDVEDPKNDMRRIPAQNRMDVLGQNGTMSSVMEKVMIEHPTFNIETLLTTTMSAQKRYVNTTVWYS